MADSVPNIEEAALQRKLLELDVQFRRQQSFWETPRAILLIVATAAAAAGFLGYKIGATPPAPIVIQLPNQPAQGR